MEPQGGRRIPSFRVMKRSTKLCRLSKTTRSRVHVQTVGLECRDKKVSAPSRRGKMSLDIPFYRTTGRKKDPIVSCVETKHETISPEQDHSITSARSNGWAECRDKKVSAPSRRRRMS